MITREEALRREYSGRVSRAIAFVYRHFGGDIGPDDMADAACFSRWHFHRVFHGLTGEGPAEFLRRVRLERAACFLMDNPSRPTTDIAMACGFSSPSVFARAFKERFGSSATEYRRSRLADWPGEGGGGSKEGKAGGREGQGEGNGGKAEEGVEEYLQGILNAHRREDMESEKFTVHGIEVKDLAAATVAFVAHTGPYNRIGEAFGRLMAWAGPRGLLGPGTRTLAIYHDSPEVTAAEKLRSSACLIVKPGTPVSGEVNLMEIPGGKYAVMRADVKPDGFGPAWDHLMGSW